MIIVKNSGLKGNITVPASKSHTIRAIAFALLAKGKSIIKNPLYSEDTNASVKAAESLGAKAKKENNNLTIISKGVSRKKRFIDVKNSGTTLRLFTSVAALQEKPVRFTGDPSIRKRPITPLLKALEKLGAKVRNYKVPFTISGPINGEKIDISGETSQYLTSLLITSPLLKNDSVISVKKLNEFPYIDMTLKWLKDLGIKCRQNNQKKFYIKGNQSYMPFARTIPGDWSSASFPICAALITNSKLLIKGLDINDTQGDKDIIKILKRMNAKISVKNNEITVKPSRLKGAVIDLNYNPDLLPILAVTACFAEGTTKIRNVMHARIKETDRIKAICRELKKMNADIRETRSGLIIRKSRLKSSNVNGHKDHRIIMALTCAGLSTEKTIITNTKNLNASYPNFIKSFNSAGANIETLKS